MKEFCPGFGEDDAPGSSEFHPIRCPFLARLAVLSPLPLNNDALFSQPVLGHFLALFIHFISCLSGPCAWHPNKGREERDRPRLEAALLKPTTGSLTFPNPSSDNPSQGVHVSRLLSSSFGPVEAAEKRAQGFPLRTHWLNRFAAK